MVKDRPLPLSKERQDEPKEVSYVVTVNVLPDANGQGVKLGGKPEEASTKTPTIIDGADSLFGKLGLDVSGAPSSASPLDDRYPEGGIRAWFVVLGCWLALFASLGFMHVLATFQTYVDNTQSIQLSQAAIGGMISGYAFINFLLGIYVGPLFDKHGPRWLILGGSVCLATSLILASFSTEYWHLLASLGILSSLGTSLLFTPAISSITHFFHRRRGLATGVATTAGSLSGIIFPPLLESLFILVGWKWAMRALALLCLALTIAAAFLIRARLPPPMTPRLTQPPVSSAHRGSLPPSSP
ncbi:hypothetical protein N0V88_003588 [Collariella sp. IMI 366227]|nr:hypothetical protein N0V88_003588 [Collariella sp. IMI 366227]